MKKKNTILLFGIILQIQTFTVFEYAHSVQFIPNVCIGKSSELKCISNYVTKISKNSQKKLYELRKINISWLYKFPLKHVIPVFSSKAIIEKAKLSIAKNDFFHLIDGAVCWPRKGTLIERNSHSSSNIVKIKILEGLWNGCEGFISKKWITTTNKNLSNVNLDVINRNEYDDIINILIVFSDMHEEYIKKSSYNLDHLIYTEGLTCKQFFIRYVMMTKARDNFFIFACMYPNDISGFGTKPVIGVFGKNDAKLYYNQICMHNILFHDLYNFRYTIKMSHEQIIDSCS